MSNAVKLLVNQLTEDLRNRPEDFTCDRHHLSDNKTKYRYWVANGVPYMGVSDPYDLTFGIWHGIRFGRALAKWKAATMITASNKVRG